MRPTPILFLSDSPSLHTGLARITRDLASLLSRSPKFRVGTLGMGGDYSRHLPFAQYNFPQDGQWGAQHLEQVWRDFAGQERGVVFTIWDSTRTFWLSQPRWCQDERLKRFLSEGHFALWGYFPIDATGPGDRLSALATESLLGYNRVLTYTDWARGVVERSLGQVEASRRRLDWLPHGLDLNLWQIRDKQEARRRFYPLLHEGDVLIGVVGTNQARKDWGLAAQCAQRLLAENPRVRFWWHIDVLERYWSVNALLADFGLSEHVLVTTQMTDAGLCWAYNACDLTWHPGLGEGFGYPIFESLACGTPSVHVDYAGGADVLRQCQADMLLVEAKQFRFDGLHNQVRPVVEPKDWLETTQVILDPKFIQWDREKLRASVAHLSWANLWEGCWRRWFEEGL